MLLLLLASGHRAAAADAGAPPGAELGPLVQSASPADAERTRNALKLHLWRFQDDGKSEHLAGEKVFSGFGAKFSLHGHDMHGLVQGPDGRLYWSIGDRGFHVRTREGGTLADAWRGAVFRCEPDGSNLEVFCRGLRNPQELVFDDLGNLFTVDNDNDAADEKPRLLHLVEGGDYGWHAGNLWLDDSLPAIAPDFRRPWFEDGIWKERFDGQPAWVMPPVAHLSNGPCGLAREPGVTLMPERWRGSFFVTDWRGGRFTICRSRRRRFRSG